MAIEERAQQRIEALLQQATHLRRGNEHGQVLFEDHRPQCAGWTASATNIIQPRRMKTSGAMRFAYWHPTLRLTRVDQSRFAVV